MLNNASVVVAWSRLRIEKQQDQYLTVPGKFEFTYRDATRR